MPSCSRGLNAGDRRLRGAHDAGERTVQQIADLLNVPRTTVYGHLNGAGNGKRPGAQRAPKSPTDNATS